MSSKHPLYHYLSDGVRFTSKEATKLRTIYFPLCGTHDASLKSSITPFLSGDIKIDKNRFLTQPASTEDLRNNVREFFVWIEGKGVVSLAKASPESTSHVEIGQLWHKLVRKHPSRGILLEAVNFIPVSGETVEVMRIKVTNISNKRIKFTPTASIPIFARSLANKHDHEHVTSLLHRTHQLPQGVLVQPTMIFNEEGHRENTAVYYAFGTKGSGQLPKGTFPTIQSFYGEGGSILYPEAVVQNASPRKLNDAQLQGKETMGALRFQDEILSKGQSREYVLVFGIADTIEQAKSHFSRFNSVKKCEAALKRNDDFWMKKSESIRFETGDSQFNSWMRWVTLQPIFRRIFGCSFLPDHDYGKGGKGWRDIWQDLLSLILIEPQEVRETLINNFGGIRIDGTNATIIGARPGEFLADRNAITRVWMDHGVWPLTTLGVYIDRTGDFDILLKEVPYFRDPQQSRTFAKDWKWSEAYGRKLKTKFGKIYQGTILEHLLVQNLVQFYNVGEHNITRLENADWNDGLDMAFKRGESVAFMSCYGGNLMRLAELLEKLATKKQLKYVSLAKELELLIGAHVNFENAASKRAHLFQQYFSKVQPEVSGAKKDFSILEVVADLRAKGQWILNFIRTHEKIAVRQGSATYRWFNGYYDNKGERVDGLKNGALQMTLTGQVFPVMWEAATEPDVQDVIKSVRAFLKDKSLGGIRLNTDFKRRHYLDLGRAFGFAYGTKENGAFFSHMTVMYAYALYKRRFSREGYNILQSIYRMCMDTEKSKIYPGIPEYFDSEGKGMYHYLTGSASWLILTMQTQVFGIAGDAGDLILAPQLVKEEFSATGKASIDCQFASKHLRVEYINSKKIDAGQYAIQKVLMNGRPHMVEFLSGDRVKIERSVIEKGPKEVLLQVYLGAN